MSIASNYLVLTRTQFGLAKSVDSPTTMPPRVFNLDALPLNTRFDRDAVLTFRIANIGGSVLLRVEASKAPGVNKVAMLATLSGDPRTFHYVIPAQSFGREGSITFALDSGTTISIDDVVLWFQEEV
jgi:hypothetical protein